MTGPKSEQEWNEERDAQPPVLDVHKAALQEIDGIVGNEDHLGPGDCANLRRIIFSALSEQHLSNSGSNASQS
jgi:hypothetical protein